MKTIRKTYLINAPLSTVWDCLADNSLMQNWNTNYTMDNTGGFSLCGGRVQGKNIDVVENSRIVQELVIDKWDEPTVLTITLIPQGKSTRLELRHINIPDKDFDRINLLWDHIYLAPLKKLAEKKSCLAHRLLKDIISKKKYF